MASPGHRSSTARTEADDRSTTVVPARNRTVPERRLGSVLMRPAGDSLDGRDAVDHLDHDHARLFRCRSAWRVPPAPVDNIDVSFEGAQMAHALSPDGPAPQGTHLRAPERPSLAG